MKTTTTVDAVAGISAGIDSDRVAYTALTMVDSGHFKTYAGAVRWLKVRGHNADRAQAAPRKPPPYLNETAPCVHFWCRR